MTVRIFLLGSAITAIASTLIWGLIVLWLDPEGAGVAGYLLFFLSLFLSIASWAALTGYGVRQLLRLQQMPAYVVRTALRQGMIMSAFVSVLLFLQLLRLYRWWLALGLLVLCISLELFFLSYDGNNRRHAQATARER